MDFFVKTLPALAGFGALLLGLGRPAVAQQAHLVLHSQPGDYIGGGLNYDLTYTPTNTNSFSAGVDLLSGSGLPGDVGFYFVSSANPGQFVQLIFGTNQLGIPLQPGTYTDAQKDIYAASGHPGLDVSLNGRENDALTGSFTITAFTGSPDVRAFNGWRVDTFDATFMQSGAFSSGALFGTFSYRSAEALAPVPEASPSLSLGVLLGLGLGGLVIAAKRKKAVA